MNWGYKIVVAFLAFTVFLGVLIYRSFQSKVSLVAPNYYEQELAYQQQIDKLNNEQELKVSAAISHDNKQSELVVVFPPDQQVKSANLLFYRPSDAAMDRNLDVSPDQDNTYKYSTVELAKGFWMVKLEWQDQSKSYLREENIYLP